MMKKADSKIENYPNNSMSVARVVHRSISENQEKWRKKYQRLTGQLLEKSKEVENLAVVIGQLLHGIEKLRLNGGLGENAANALTILTSSSDVELKSILGCEADDEIWAVVEILSRVKKAEVQVPVIAEVHSPAITYRGRFVATPTVTVYEPQQPNKLHKLGGENR